MLRTELRGVWEAGDVFERSGGGAAGGGAHAGVGTRCSGAPVTVDIKHKSALVLEKLEMDLAS
eukprot:3084593-Rhodomonas_salina.2